MKKTKHEALRIAVFLCLSLAILALLRFVPAFHIGSYEFKPVDVLADIMPGDEDGLNTDSALFVPVVKPEWSDSCPEKMICIDDYALDYKSNMGRFYEALTRRDSLGRPVRIAYFGDSYIEGDILTSDLREMLQKNYGGCGVGYVDIASSFVALRPTLYHRYGGWADHCVLDSVPFVRSKIGISGRYAVADSAAFVRISGVKKYERLDTFEVATLYLATTYPATVWMSANGRRVEPQKTAGTGGVEAVSHEGRMGTVRFDVGRGTTCFGMAVEGKKGVVVDNLSLRGSSGMNILSITERHLTELSAVRPYDLIVLQYGLNVASPRQTNYDYYKEQMTKVIERLKKTNPDAAILIVSIGDRENKIGGKLQTLPGVKALIPYQNNLAADNNVAFWNLYKAMGGEGSIVKMADATPAEAARDYTHINYHGGRKIATLLYDAIVFGHKEYERRNDYEEDKP